MRIGKKIIKALGKNLKFSISNPTSFKEIWSFNSNGIRVISLLLLLIILASFAIAYFFGARFFSSETKTIEREKLEAQTLAIDSLSSQIQAQENYILAIRKMLSGELPVVSTMDSIPEIPKELDLSNISTQKSKEEVRIAEKVKADLMTQSTPKESNIPYFGNPVTGVISQTYDRKTHYAIDIVTERNMAVKACLAGTVIYAGYTRRDGYIIVIDHGNKFLSIYKHNKRILKKTGSKVKLGDPIAIVGDTGENSDGPHLHFELWLDQQPVNPIKYMDFKH